MSLILFAGYLKNAEVSIGALSIWYVINIALYYYYYYFIFIHISQTLQCLFNIIILKYLYMLIFCI